MSVFLNMVKIKDIKVLEGGICVLLFKDYFSV